MGTVTWLPVDGPKVEEAVDASPTLEKLQEYVGGYIEVVPVWNDSGCDQLIINEEGLMYLLKPNPHTKELVGRTLVGNAVLLEGSARLD